VASCDVASNICQAQGQLPATSSTRDLNLVLLSQVAFYDVASNTCQAHCRQVIDTRFEPPFLKLSVGFGVEVVVSKFVQPIRTVESGNPADRISEHSIGVTIPE